MANSELMDRRGALIGLGALAGAGLAGCAPLVGGRIGVATQGSSTKVVVVQFGGGLRNSESIDDPRHRFIPRLWRDLIPRGTLFANARVEHRVVHPNSTGSMMTGHWEWDDLDWSRPVAHPSIFEVARRARRLDDTGAWAFVYASILARTGESRAPGFGSRWAANVVEPPTIPRTTAARMDRLMLEAAARGEPEGEEAAAHRCAALARRDAVFTRAGMRSPTARAFLNRRVARWRAGGGTTSHDAFLVDTAVACMARFAPPVVAVDMGEIDCAHYGSWSRYTEAIARTDALTWRLWRATRELPAYRDRTLMLILPDHGRQLDTPGGDGFVHHSDFYTDRDADEGCRRVWMLALGPGVAAGRRRARPVPITAVAATALQHLGLEASRGAAHSVLPLAS